MKNNQLSKAIVTKANNSEEENTMENIIFEEKLKNLKQVAQEIIESNRASDFKIKLENLKQVAQEIVDSHEEKEEKGMLKMNLQLFANKESSVEVVNLTPHAINIVGGPTFEPSGEVARISSANESAGELVVNGESIPLITQEFGEITGLPEEKEGTLYIVSGLVFSNSSRKDLLAPGEQVRDEKGRVIGCKSFQVKEVSEEEVVEVRSYTFNNKQGRRDRKVAAAVWYEGQTYTLDEAKEAKLASVTILDREKGGKWSNETMRVVVKSAILVVFREPFEGWSQDKNTALEQARKSAQEYLGEDISSDVLWDVMKKFYPRKSSYMKTAKEQGWSLI